MPKRSLFENLFLIFSLLVFEEKNNDADKVEVKPILIEKAPTCLINQTLNG